MHEPDQEQEREPVELPIREGYDRWAAIYDHEDNPLIELERGQVERFFTEAKGQAVLDAGCGTGRHAVALSHRGAQVTAIDISEGMLAKARSKVGAQTIQFLHCDLESQLPFTNDSFDFVISGLVVDHIADLVSYFSELNRVCRSTGNVLISVMHPAMTLRGAQARFNDPTSGSLVLPESQNHSVSDYVMAVLRSRLTIKSLSEFLVDEGLASKSARAKRYLGWPLLLVMDLTP